jgi:hypothetical protein
LVLFTYWFVQLFDLDTTGLFGQLRRVHQIFAQCVQGFEQRCCETPRRAEPCPRWYICHACDLQVAFLYAG